MKYSIPVTLVLVCALSPAARAQEAAADVLANVAQALALTSQGQTNFGTIDNFAHTEVINPATPTADQETAMFVFSTGGGSISLTCPSAVTLTEPTSSAEMTFTPQLSVANGPDQQSFSDPLPPCPLSGSGAFQVWLWLGGSLDVGSNQGPGSYSGVFTLSAAYL